MPIHTRSAMSRSKKPRCLFGFERLECRFLLALFGGAPSHYPDGTLAMIFEDDGNNTATLDYLDSNTYRLTVNGVTFDYPTSSVQSLAIIGSDANETIQLGSTVPFPTSIWPGEGDDLVVGGAGADTILGDTGNDTLIGNGGDDVLDGTDSVLCYSKSDGNTICGPPPLNQSHDSIDGGDGDDTIWGDPLTDTLEGGPGNNDIETETNLECVSVDTTDRDPPLPNSIFFEFIGTETARVTVSGDSFNFPQQLVECFEAATGDAADLIEIDPSVTILTDISSGGGNDTIIGGPQPDYLDGGDGDDSIVGAGGDDSLLGGAGSDSLDSGAGNDSLDGGPGDDSVTGGDGDDTLADGMGDDTLDGGTGGDVYVMTPGSDDLLRDSGGHDRLDFSRAGRGVTIDLGLGRGRRQTVDSAGNTITLRGDFEHAAGSPFADDLVGNGQPNRLDGGGGDDTLDGGGGDRSLHGRGGGAPTDRRSGNGCDGDTLIGAAGQDWLDGGRGRDQLDGGSDDDTLVADAARDTLDGGAGNNRTVAVTKSDAACPAVAATVSPPPIFFDALSGTLSVSGDEVRAVDNVAGIVVTPSGFVQVTLDGAVHSGDPTSSDFDAFLAEATGDAVLAVLFAGGAGNDALTLGDGFANAGGQITIDGGAGDDSLVGSSGDEYLSGGPGNDALAGGGGDDWLVGGAGNDSLDGGSGDDTADFSAATRGVKVDLARGTSKSRGDGRDRLAAIENLLGSNFSDLLIGDALANLLIGGNGNDVIRGGDGPDTLRGGSGNDQLRGDAGADMVIGNAGIDRLLVERESDQLVTDLLDKLKDAAPRGR